MLQTVFVFSCKRLWGRSTCDYQKHSFMLIYTWRAVNCWFWTFLNMPIVHMQLEQNELISKFRTFVCQTCSLTLFKTCWHNAICRTTFCCSFQHGSILLIFFPLCQFFYNFKHFVAAVLMQIVQILLFCLSSWFVKLAFWYPWRWILPRAYS